MKPVVNTIVSGPKYAPSTYQTIVLKSNQDFKAVVESETNKKYIIKYDFDLGGETVTMPEGCLIEMDGGTISNGTMVGDHTILIYFQDFEDCIKSVTMQGTWKYNNPRDGIMTENIYDENLDETQKQFNARVNVALEEANRRAQAIIPLPDEEDLTTDGEHNIKLKNKAYTPANYSGLGRKYLRKNIVNGVNTLTQSMINQSNTIYIIQYDFTLGEDITIPANCVLEFDGGSIGGEHTITGQNTCINAGLVKIFNTDVTLAGSWNVAEVYPEWFGAKGDGVTDDTDAIERCLVLKIPTHFTKSYIAHPSLHIYNNIYGNGELIFEGYGYGLFITGVNNINIIGITFNANGNPIDILRVENANNLIIQNCVFKNISGTGNASIGAIQVNSIHGLIISNSSFSNITNTDNSACYGISVSNTQAKNIRIENCTFNDILSPNDADCIKIIGVGTAEVNAIVENCTFSNFGWRAIKSQATNVTTRNNTIYVTIACLACIDFQRGGGRSLNDTIYVNFGSGSISGLIKLGGSNNTLKGLRVYYLNGTSDSSNSLLAIEQDGEEIDTTIKNVIIEDVVATGMKYFLRISDGITEIENLNISNCIHTLSSDDTSTYYSIRFMNLQTLNTVKNSYIELSFSPSMLSNEDTKFEDSIIKSFKVNSNTISMYILREKNIIDFNTNYSNSLIKSVLIKQNKGIFYAKQDFSVNNNTTSAAQMLRGSKIGDIVYIPAVNTEGSIKVGYICIADGTNAATGTFKDYII